MLYSFRKIFNIIIYLFYIFDIFIKKLVKMIHGLGNEMQNIKQKRNFKMNIINSKIENLVGSVITGI